MLRTITLLSLCLCLVPTDLPARGKLRPGWTKKRIIKKNRECRSIFSIIKGQEAKTAGLTKPELIHMCRCLVRKASRIWRYRTVEYRLKKYVEKILEQPDHEECMPKGKNVAMMSKLFGPGDKTITETKSKNVQVVTEAKADTTDKDSVDLASIVSSEENLRKLFTCIQKWEDADKPQEFTVTLTIENDGKVGLVEILPPRYRRGKFFKCVEKTFYSLNFGKSNRCSRTITIPFNFFD